MSERHAPIFTYENFKVKLLLFKVLNSYKANFFYIVWYRNPISFFKAPLLALFTEYFFLFQLSVQGSQSYRKV